MPTFSFARAGRLSPISRKPPNRRRCQGSLQLDGQRFAANLNEKKLDVKTCPLPATRLGELIREVKSDRPEQAAGPRSVRRHVCRRLFCRQRPSPSSASRSWPTKAELLEIVRRAIAGNPKAVADYKKGKTKAADAIKGAVMRETKGMAKTETVQRLLLKKLEA